MAKLFLALFVCGMSWAQQPAAYNIQADFFRGNIYRHTDDINHLITGHPSGFLLSFNKKTHGHKEWQQVYNYPDHGFSLQYQDFKNDILGKNLAIGVHYDFYFLRRHLMFRISQGIGFTTNPYDKMTNYRNNAFGSKLMSSNHFMLNYKKENIIDRLGLQAGFLFTHFSNGRIKSPNSGINSFTVNLGVNYNLGEQSPYLKADSTDVKNYAVPIRYNIVLRTGVSESQVVESGQKPFYHFGFYADKRVGRKSALQLGADVFFSEYLKEYIKYTSVAYPNRPPTDPGTDYRRVAVVAGHELFINRLSIETQVGYYFYKPFRYESDIYQRVGGKYYFNDNVFAGVALKAHGARAEAIEFGLGVRL